MLVHFRLPLEDTEGDGNITEQALESLIPGTKGGLFPAGDVASINGEVFAV